MKFGDWGLGPIPNPQSPIPNFIFKIIIIKILEIIIYKNIIDILSFIKY